MMLEHLGEKPAAERLMKAVERVTADPSLHTPDLGGKATTRFLSRQGRPPDPHQGEADLCAGGAVA